MRKLSHQTNLLLFVDDEGILRCSGRIQYSSLPYDSKFPMLLPNGHYFTKLIIATSHEQVWHNKVHETLTQLRSRFWVIRGRKAVKEIVSKCVLCKRMEGKYYSTPAAPPVPSYRVADDFGFMSIGIDHAGPVFVKNIHESDGTMYKAYITVITCTVTRAIHLELSLDLNADSLIRALKRFKGIRGIPALVLSDNSRTFKDRKVKAFLLRVRIQWRFNVPRAGWWGGFLKYV